MKTPNNFDNRCPECDSDRVVFKPVATRNWRGWQAECLNCGEIVEYDEYKEVPDYRST